MMMLMMVKSVVADETEMVATWFTEDRLEDTPIVEYGPTENDLSFEVIGETSHFNEEDASFYTHRALMTNLKPSYQYCEYKNVQCKMYMWW